LPEKKEKQMRRTIVLLTTMAMTLLVAASVAMAISRINCTFSGECRGTDAGDWIYGGGGNNLIYGDNLTAGGGGDDHIYGRAGDDSILGMEGKDSLSGGDGKNLLGGGDGDDFHSGGVGNDTYDGGPGNDIYKDGTPANRFFSSDTYFGPKSGQVAITGTGFDSVYDSGGFDVADLRSLNRSDVWVQWADSRRDADAEFDTMSIYQVENVSPTFQANVITFWYYFDNKGGPGRGAVETIKFKDGTDLQFPLNRG
jgi:Ca2+-binding RTX toxin-like protein